jgi:hypothetical protein
MPVFLDVHKVSQIEGLVKTHTRGEIRNINTYFNRDADLCYYMLDAPNKEAIEKYHSKLNVKCELIIEIK